MTTNEQFKNQVSQIFPKGSTIESSDYSQLADAVADFVTSQSPSTGSTSGDVNITTRARKGSINNPIKPEWINMNLEVTKKSTGEIEIAYNSAPFYGFYIRGLETKISLYDILGGSNSFTVDTSDLFWEIYGIDNPQTAVMMGVNGVHRYYTVSWPGLNIYKVSDGYSREESADILEELQRRGNPQTKYLVQLTSESDGSGGFRRLFEWSYIVTNSRVNAVYKFLFDTTVTGTASFKDNYDPDTGTGLKYLRGENIHINTVKIIKTDMTTGAVTAYDAVPF